MLFLGRLSAPYRNEWTLAAICCGVAVSQLHGIRADRLEVDLELDLADAQALRADQRSQQVLDAGVGLQAAVDLDRPAEDALELVNAAEVGQRRAVFLLDVEEEVLVACVAHERGVAMAVGDELERLGAAHLLVAGLQVDLLVLLAVVAC